MDTIKKWFTWERVVIIILLFLLIFGSIWFVPKYNKQYKELTEANLFNQKSVALVNERNQFIHEQALILTENQDEIRKLTAKAFNLQEAQEKRIKEVIAYYSERLRLQVDTFEITYDTIEIPTEEEPEMEEEPEIDYDHIITVPKTVRVDSSDFKLDLTILKDRLRINQILFTDTQYIRVVEKKNGWFKPKTLEIQALHTNRRMEVLGQNSVLYKPKPKNQWLIKSLILGAGIFIGVQIAK